MGSRKGQERYDKPDRGAAVPQKGQKRPKYYGFTDIKTQEEVHH